MIRLVPAAAVGLGSALLLILGAAAPATAASSPGTQHEATTSCDATGCLVVTDQYNDVVTPNGNTNSVEKLGVVATDGTYKETVKGHTLTRDGVVQQSTSYSSVGFVLPGFTCVVSERTITANGQLRHDKTAIDCG